VRLQNSSHDGVGPEALSRTVLGLHLLGFRSWVRVTGVQHGLQDTPTSIDEPEQEQDNDLLFPHIHFVMEPEIKNYHHHFKIYIFLLNTIFTSSGSNKKHHLQIASFISTNQWIQKR